MFQQKNNENKNVLFSNTLIGGGLKCTQQIMQSLPKKLSLTVLDTRPDVPSAVKLMNQIGSVNRGWLTPKGGRPQRRIVHIVTNVS